MQLSSESKIRYPFSIEKGVAVLQYLLSHVGGTYNYMALLKLAFFADRYHVRNHARPVSMDEYFAFEYGPAGSMLKNILLESDVIFEDPPIKRALNHNVVLVDKEVDLDQFSKSDIKALDFSIERFASIGKRYRGQFVLSEITHAYPEWNQYADLFNSHKTIREEINYETFLDDPSDDHPFFIKHSFTDPFIKLSPAERNNLVVEMREYSANIA
jgi:uncharacterized phage-associated protein